MNERQKPQQQGEFRGQSDSSKGPYDDPTPPDKPPCPPKEDCPKPKPCPDPPTRPPDPCDDKAPTGDMGTGGTSQTPEHTPTQQTPPYQRTEDQTATRTTTGTSSTATPAAHLADLKRKWDYGQKKLQQLEPLKTEMADLAQRIQTFEKAVEGQSGSAKAYKDFYRSAELLQSDLNCFVPTARCQLELTDKQKNCICDAIVAVDARVAKAQKDSEDQKLLVITLEADARRAARDLEWTTKWYDFLKTGLQQQITKQRDDLKAIKALVTPTANPCEVWFSLYELERLTLSQYGGTEACWKDNLTIGTFLDCWSWECYETAWNKVLVEYNTADAADKLAKSKLDQAKKLATDLDKLATEAVSKRREWILKEIKAKDCCGPLSNCP